MTVVPRKRNEISRHLRSCIWPEDYDAMAEQEADILVIHEAPTCHKYGFTEMDDLADMSGVKLVVHGHHHKSYFDKTPSSIPVRGLGKAEPWLWSA